MGLPVRPILCLSLLYDITSAQSTTCPYPSKYFVTFFSPTFPSSFLFLFVQPAIIFVIAHLEIMSQSTWTKFTDFVAARKVAVIVGTVAVVGTSAGAYYYYLNNNTIKPKGKSSKKLNKNEKKKLKKAKKAKTSESTIAGFKLVQPEGLDVEYPDIDDFEKVKSLSKEDKSSLAQQFKLAGNDYFAKKEFNKALELYADALKCETDSAFYANRAACFMGLQQYEKVIDEATKGLELKPEYLKLIVRRASAYEKLENYKEALFDFSSALILANLSDATLNESVERVLKEYSTESATEVFKTRAKTLPPQVFINSFFQSFGVIEIPEEIRDAEEGSGDALIKAGIEAIHKYEYKESLENFEKAIEKEANHASIAYAYKACYEFLSNQNEEALDDINKSLDLEPSYLAHIIRSSLFLDSGNVAAADIDFESALKLSPDNAAIYYTRAQSRFLVQKAQEAADDFKKAIELDPEFILPRIHLAILKYRAGQQTVGLQELEDLTHLFPHSPEAHNYYGEILLDAKRIDDAIAQFDRAIEADGAVPNRNNSILLVNKAIALFQKDPNNKVYLDTLIEASEKDPENDIIYSTLAQLYIQTGKTTEAIPFLEKAAKLTKSLNESIQTFSILYATETQIRIRQDRPFLINQISMIQNSMAAAAAAQQK